LHVAHADTASGQFEGLRARNIDLLIETVCRRSGGGEAARRGSLSLSLNLKTAKAAQADHPLTLPGSSPRT
jgi:hypothetical protein